jgi:hypothetical protein
MQMTARRADDGLCRELDEDVVKAALETLAPLAETGPPAWADVLERAALQPCTCPAPRLHKTSTP